MQSFDIFASEIISVTKCNNSCVIHFVGFGQTIWVADNLMVKWSQFFYLYLKSDEIPSVKASPLLFF